MLRDKSRWQLKMLRDKSKYWGQAFNRSRWWRERGTYVLLGFLGKPQSYLDIGCGDSYIVKLMGKLLGKENSIGVDIFNSTSQVINHDLRQPLDLKRKFDLVVSTEVGEHLPKESADTYCDTLIKHSSKWLVFSAALIGQGGYDHINEQPIEYWLEKLTNRGFALDSKMTEVIALTWSSFVPDECKWAYDNLMIFRRNDGT